MFAAFELVNSDIGLFPSSIPYSTIFKTVSNCLLIISTSFDEPASELVYWETFVVFISESILSINW